MKWWLLALLGLAGLAAFATTADATTTCHATGNWCQGFSHVSTNTGVSGTRCFELRTTNAASTCTTGGSTPVNEATWEMVAGNCITFYYFDSATGISPPLAPNKVSIQVYPDTQVAVAIITYQANAAEPANGQSYSFCATSNGLSSGSPRAGTYNLYLRAIKDNGIAAQNYDVSTNGVQTAGTLVSYDKGAVRGQILVSDIAHSAYPTGSTFAYGAAGDESVTITATFTQPNTPDASNVETAFDSVLDNAGLTVGQAGTTVDLDTQTTLAQSFVLDSTFPAANSPYVGGFTIAGNAALTGLKWTVLASTGHGSCVTRVSDTFAYCSTTFAIDPGIKFDSDGSGSYATADEVTVPRLTTCSGAVVQVFNKGETVCNSWYLMNSRGELLSRAMTFVREDSAATVCNSLGSLTPTANKYSNTAVISTGTTCLAAHDLVGAPRYIRATNTDQNHRSNAVYGVSTFYYADYHAQRTTTLVQDDWPTQNSAEQTTYVISADVMHIWCHVRGVRLDTNIDTGVNDVIVKETETDDTTVIDTFTIGTGSDGWTTASDSVAPSPPSRTIHGHCDVSFNGNTASDTQSIGWSSAFTGDLNCRLSIVDWHPTVGVGTRVFLMITQAHTPIQPDEAPHIDIDYADNTTDPATWVNLVSHVQMLNVVDDTPTPNGSLYYYDWTPTISAIVNIENHCQIAGSPVYQDSKTAVRPAGLLELQAMNNFNGFGFDGFLFIIAWNVGMILMLRHKKLLSAIACGIGLGVSIFQLQDGWQAVSLSILLISLWIEALGKDKIIYHWFQNKA